AHQRVINRAAVIVRAVLPIPRRSRVVEDVLQYGVAEVARITHEGAVVVAEAMVEPDRIIIRAEAAARLRKVVVDQPATGRLRVVAEQSRADGVDARCWNDVAGEGAAATAGINRRRVEDDPGARLHAVARRVGDEVGVGEGAATRADSVGRVGALQRAQRLAEIALAHLQAGYGVGSRTGIDLPHAFVAK